MGAIPQHTIEQVAAANDIVEVIGSYFPLKRAGANFRALCPFHQEKTPSFHVSPTRQSFHCFGCGAGGSVFRFVMDYEHVDFPTSLRRLAARVGIPVIEERSGPDEDRQHEARRTLLKLHAEAADWFHENLLKKEFAAPAREHLKQRGITKAVVKSWRLGFAPESWDAFSTWARERGYSIQDLITSGLVSVRESDPNQPDATERYRRPRAYIAVAEGQVSGRAGGRIDRRRTLVCDVCPSALFRRDLYADLTYQFGGVKHTGIRVRDEIAQSNRPFAFRTETRDFGFQREQMLLRRFEMVGCLGDEIAEHFAIFL